MIIAHHQNAYFTKPGARLTTSPIDLNPIYRMMSDVMFLKSTYSLSLLDPILVI